MYPHRNDIVYILVAVCILALNSVTFFLLSRTFSVSLLLASFLCVPSACNRALYTWYFLHLHYFFIESIDVLLIFRSVSFASLLNNSPSDTLSLLPSHFRRMLKKSRMFVFVFMPK